jgi:signal transduction histidine kinase
MNGIESTLKQYKEPIELDVEYMDTRHFNDEKHYNNLYAIYKNKAGKKQYDVIIASDNDALSFLVKHRQELYPSVPIVFCGVNDFNNSLLGGYSDITGVTEEETFGPTVETALRFHPLARQALIVLNQKSPDFNNRRQQVAEIALKFRGKTEFVTTSISEIYSGDLPKKLDGLGKETVIILACLFTTPINFPFYREASEAIRKHCASPIYVPSERWFEYVPVVVGGKVASGFHHGKTAAEMAIRIIDGEPVQNIPVQRGTAEKYIFDYTQLKRFGLPFSSLPEGSIVINEPQSFYHLYKKRILMTVGTISVLTAMVTLLSISIIHLRRLERKLLNYQSQLKSLTSQLSHTERYERRRIAKELHNSVRHPLIISKTKLENLRGSASDASFAEGVGGICTTLEQAIRDTKSLTFDLDSPILYRVGLEAAIMEWLAEQIHKKHGIKSEFEDDGQPKPLDDTRVILFRNVQELLMNVVKHSNASEVKVSVQKVDGTINISVEDNGVGFDAAEVMQEATKRKRLGLFSIREQLEQLRGRLVIESRLNFGTRVTVIAPLKQNKPDDSKR